MSNRTMRRLSASSSAAGVSPVGGPNRKTSDAESRRLAMEIVNGSRIIAYYHFLAASRSRFAKEPATPRRPNHGSACFNRKY